VYTTDDGLPSNLISRIVRDSRGFLWFGIRRGLARFDGYNFASITGVVETPAGNYWISTALFRLRPADTGKPAQRLTCSANYLPVYLTQIGLDQAMLRSF
jgi:hypothetical protein